VTALVLDDGAFVPVDRGDRAMLARLRIAAREGLELRTSAIVLGQVWRDGRGRQARLADLLRAVEIRVVDAPPGRAAGVLVGRAGTADPIDASLVLLARPGDRILTGDPDDLARLAGAAGIRATIVSC
jgi:hypothetical protein